MKLFLIIPLVIASYEARSQDSLPANLSTKYLSQIRLKSEHYRSASIMNFVDEGGSRTLKTLEHVVAYDNTLAQGATKEYYDKFASEPPQHQNSKYPPQIIGRTLFTNLNTGRGEHKQSDKNFYK